MLEEIEEIHAWSDGTYGAVRITEELRPRAHEVGVNRVARLMRAAGIEGVSRRKGTRTTVRGEETRPAGAFDAFGNTGTFNYAVGPVLSWAAFDLGRVRARVDEARAYETEAKARHDQTILRALEELDAAAVRYTTARARLAHLEGAAGASERAAALAARRYEGGVADFLQVLDAERTLLVAQDELARGRTAAAEAYVGLYEARGGMWGPS